MWGASLMAIPSLADKKIYDKIGGQYQYALREEGKKIYIVHPHYETASLLYDFGKNAGDVIDELAYPLIVASVDTIDTDGVKFRRMRIQDANKPVEKWSNDLINMYNFWIEGVGSESLLETSIREPGNAYNLISCQINGRVYTQQELLGIASKPTPQDDYIPFVEIDKGWDVVISYDAPYYGGSISSFGMGEEVERDGKSYAHTKRYLLAECEVQEAGLFREENRRVYKYDEKTGKDIMMYDFSLKEGDTFTYEFGFDQPVNCKVLKQGWLTEGPKIATSCTLTPDDTLDIKYRWLHTWTIGRENGSGEYDEIATWVEGIGALENVFGLIDNGYMKLDYSLAYVVRKDKETGYDKNAYLPFSFCDKFMHGCNLPTGKENEMENDKHHKLTYELEGDRLHIYGEAFTQCGPYNYAFFYEKPTDDPLVHTIDFMPWGVWSVADSMALHTTNFYVPGFDPNINYIVRDNQGEEHPVINKTSQMDYRPLVEEGKVWKVGTIPTALDSPVQVVDYYYFDGDTIIGGKTCKQMMCQRYVSPDFSDEYWTPRPSLTKVGAWYEEDKKVYSFDERQQTMTLKYDFSLEANDTLHFLNVDDYPPFIIGPKQTGGMEGFKGVYRDIMMCRDEGQNIINTTWLEGVGGLDAPFRNAYDPRADLVPEFLISCTVGDEIIYLNDRYEDEATPESMGARKNRFDFTHTARRCLSGAHN